MSHYRESASRASQLDMPMESVASGYMASCVEGFVAGARRAKISYVIAGTISLLLVSALPLPCFAGLLEGKHPLVDKGNQAYQKGDFEGALRAYEEAEKELPNSPELKFNQGDAYMQLGRADDAKRAFEAALSGASKELKAADYYNMGNALAGMNQRADAITAFRQSLKADPSFEPARRNLEVLLRQKNKPQQDQPKSSGDGGLPDAGDAGNEGNDAGSDSDAGKDGGGADQSKNPKDDRKDSRSDAGQSDAGEQKQQAQQQPKPQPKNDAQDAGVPDAGPNEGTGKDEQEKQEKEAKPLDRQEAERLLDAMRRNEKQFLMQQHNRKTKQRGNPEKNW